MGIKYPEVNEGGPGKSLGVAPLSVKDNIEPKVYLNKCTMEPEKC